MTANLQLREDVLIFAKNEKGMTAQEKKQQLIEKVQQIPEGYYDDITKLLDAILNHQEVGRNERFEKLLTETSVKYKAVWEALA